MFSQNVFAILNFCLEGFSTADVLAIFSPRLLRVFRTWSNELWTFLKRFSGNVWILDVEKHVYVRTKSITAIVTEWIFYGLPLFTGFDFWIWLSQDYWILLSTNQELLLRILFQVLSSKARWMESIYGTKQDCACELCVNTSKASCENLFSWIKDFASGFYWQVIQEHSLRTL